MSRQSQKLETELQGLYSELFGYRNEMACKFDTETRLIVVNDAYAQAMNATVTELIGKKFIDLIPREEHNKVLSHLRALTEKYPERTYEHKVILSDGTEKWQQWYDRAIFDEAGKLKYFISLGRDITAAKILELEIDQRNRFQAILTDLAIRLINLPVSEFDAAMEDVLSIVGIYIRMEFAFVNFRDETGRITRSNHWNEHSKDSGQLAEMGHVLAAMEELTLKHTDQSTYVEDIQNLPDNNPLKVRLNSFGVKTLVSSPLVQEKKIIGNVTFFTLNEVRLISDMEIRLLKVLAELISNVETRRFYEKKLIEARNEAESANEAKTQFLANMSHEIRTPLNGMLGMTSLLLGTMLDERQKQYVNVLNSSGESLRYIINDLLDMNKFGGNRLSLDRSVFRLWDVISEVSELLKTEADQKKLAYDVEIQGDKTGLVLRGAKLRFKQVLTNLLSNAIKFTSKGGVRIECAVSQPSGAGDKVKVTCRVTDTGIGIGQQDFSKLFKPFSQVDPSTSRKYGGTGLGLHISKTIVEQLGGEIGIESEPGIRTTAWFYVFFDIVSQQEAVTDHGLLPRETQKSQHILLAAFPAETVHSLQRDFELLQLSSYALPTIEQTKAHLKQLKARHHPQFIFIDYSTTGLQALELTDELKNDFNHLNRMVVLVANPEDEPRQDWIVQHDIYRIILRPLTIEKLIEVVFSVSEGRAELNLTLPKAMQKKSLAAINAGDLKFPPKPPKRKKVLIAEDNAVNQELISVIMEELNTACKIVSNGLEALRAVKENDYDLILMDCQMPEMDGFDASRAIRALDDPKKSQIPIIAVTAHVIEGYQQKCKAAGMNGYISKPYSIKYLKAAIDNPETTAAVLHQEDFRALKIIDYERYLRRFGNDAEICSQILVRFAEETRSQLTQMSRLWDERSYDRLFDLVHSIKGASANIDAERMFSAALKLSVSIERRQLKMIPKRMERLQHEFNRLCEWQEQNQ